MKTKILKKALSLTLSLALLVTCAVSPNTAYAVESTESTYLMHYEAEDQGEGIHYYNTIDSNIHENIVSGRLTVGDMDSTAMLNNGTVWPTADKLNSGKYNFEENLDKLPYVAYEVTVVQSGIYNLEVGYLIKGVKRNEHKLVLYANGQAYEALFHDTELVNSENAGAYSKSSAQVYLKAGENTVYVFPFDETYRSNMDNGQDWVNQDYLEVVSWEAYRDTRMEAETYGIANNYSIIEEDSRMSEGQGVGGANYGELANYDAYKDGTVTLSNQPYVQYRVKADTKGEYNLKIGYLFGNRKSETEPEENLENPEKQYMIVIVNDDITKPIMASYNAPNPSKPAVVKAEVKVELNADINTITCIPFDQTTRETYFPNGYINQDYLDIPDCLTPIEKPVRDRYEAEDQELHNYIKINGEDWTDFVSGKKTVGSMDESKMTAAGIKWPTAEKLNNGSYNFEENKDALPYVPYTVEVAQSAVYEMKVGYIMSDNNRADHKMLLYVNGLAYEAPYTESDKYDTGAYSESSVQVHLNKGNNTVYCIPFDQEYKDKDNNKDAWVNQDYLEVGERVGYKYTRVEAENTELTRANGYKNMDRTWESDRGIVVMGGAPNSPTGWPTAETLNDGSFTKAMLQGIPYMAYNLQAEEAGTYKLKVGYMVAGGDYASHNMLLYVNGKAYQAPYNNTRDDWQPYSESEVEVYLQVGENVIYCIPFEQEYKDKDNNKEAWLNQDYLEFPDCLTPIGKPVRMEAEDQGDRINHYDTAANSTWSDVVSNGKTIGNMATTGATVWPTAAELNDGTYNFEAKKSDLPYVAYQVSVAKAGVYEMKVGYMISDGDLATHKMLLYVNELAYEAPYTKSAKNPAGKTFYSESSTQVALNAGENTVYCISFDAAYRAANKDVWVNHDYLEIGTKLDTPKAVSGLVSAGDRTALADIKDEMIPQFGENAYTAYAVWAPTAGTYTITANATGAGYPAMLVNGAVYKYSGAKEVNLNAGINIVYCLRIAGFSIRYTGLTIADELYAADRSCMVIPGDANGDRSVDVKDLVHAKKSATKYIYAVDFYNNDTDVSNNTSDLRSVLLGEMKMLIKTPKTSTL